MIMEAKLPVRLRVLIPAVENAISGAAFRPGDVIPSRKGLTRRDRQHRRRGAPDPGRRAGARRRGGARPAARLRHADRRRARRAGARPAAALHRRRGPRRRRSLRHGAGGQRSRLADAAVEALRSHARQQGRRRQQHLGRRLRRLGHGGAVPAALRRRRRRAGRISTSSAGRPSARPGRPEGGEPQTARLVLALVRQRYGRIGLTARPCRAAGAAEMIRDRNDRVPHVRQFASPAGPAALARRHARPRARRGARSVRPPDGDPPHRLPGDAAAHGARPRRASSASASR